MNQCHQQFWSHRILNVMKVCGDKNLNMPTHAIICLTDERILNPTQSRILWIEEILVFDECYIQHSSWKIGIFSILRFYSVLDSGYISQLWIITNKQPHFTNNLLTYKWNWRCFFSTWVSVCTIKVIMIC